MHSSPRTNSNRPIRIGSYYPLFFARCTLRVEPIQIGRFELVHITRCSSHDAHFAQNQFESADLNWFISAAVLRMMHASRRTNSNRPIRIGSYRPLFFVSCSHDARFAQP
ncbi:hypothetical protein AMTR_s00024p00196040 [Amborella trichopoda]|uniref:Uncharacterized protein n=1 Tax=Amborella trichopoda TaxID=13333 RepID=W1PTN3_AMBTC|nr:hypothetical protein AMTR_s00024p00196040 [Amborella trichopoda]